MLALISPAKTLDFDSPLSTRKFSQPEFLDASNKLINTLKGLSSKRLAKLMKISPKLAELNHQRFSDWQLPFTQENARPAVMAFKGDVYLGLEAWNLSQRDLNWAQKHLRILSGLYGILKPLDLMQPYRLEMGTALKTCGAKNLYQFWQDDLSEHLNHTLESNAHKVLVNLASMEYFQAINPKLISSRIITPSFLNLNNGEYKFLSFFAKKARGSMARYIIENRVTSLKALKKFDSADYRYCEKRSEGNSWVFIRDY